ncbi:MAG: hypothetical protein AB9915_00220 [Candidatus Dojkabacteria bacterium]
MTLTEAAFWTKRFGVIALGAGIIFITVVLILTIKPKESMPPEYLTANFACTEKKQEFLDNKLDIPSLKLADGSEMVFEILTDTGKIDSLPQIINVFKFENPTQSLSAQANAKILAKKMGFDPDAVIRKGTQSYVWVDKEYKRNLEIQAKNMNFSLKTEPARIKEVAQTGVLPSEQDAKIQATSMLRTLGLYSEDYSVGDHKTTYININPDGSYSKASSASEAELIRVDFVREKSMITIASNIVGADSMVELLSDKMGIEPTKSNIIINDKKIDVFTYDTIVTFPETQRHNISIYIGVEDKEKKGAQNALNAIYQIDFKYWPIQVEACGTYELLSPQKAIEEVQAGNGRLVYLFDKNGDDVVPYTPKRVKKFIVTKDIFLTYYESPEELGYLQPVYVISGDAIFENDIKGTFDFYYPAINYDIVQDKIVLPPPVVEEKKSWL